MTHSAADPYESSPGFRADLAAIADALHAGRRATRHDPRILREAVRTAAVHSRENRSPPEKLVRALKELVRNIALEDDTDAYRLLYTDRVIAWAIESYYELSER